VVSSQRNNRKIRKWTTPEMDDIQNVANPSLSHDGKIKMKRTNKQTKHWSFSCKATTFQEKTCFGVAGWTRRNRKKCD